MQIEQIPIAIDNQFQSILRAINRGSAPFGIVEKKNRGNKEKCCKVKKHKYKHLIEANDSRICFFKYWIKRSYRDLFSICSNLNDFVNWVPEIACLAFLFYVAEVFCHKCNSTTHTHYLASIKRTNSFAPPPPQHRIFTEIASKWTDNAWEFNDICSLFLFSQRNYIIFMFSFKIHLNLWTGTFFSVAKL